MIKMDETVLGFQLRLPPNELQAWDSQRRTTYLLGEELLSPLSVDTAVWPESNDHKRLAEVFEDFSPLPNSAPNGLGLYSVKSEEILRQTTEARDSVLIGISVTDNVAKALQSQHHLRHLTSLVELSSKGWIELGYDVANWWLMSGLTNCGYTLKEKAELLGRFSNSINSDGLFASVHAAREFGNYCNARFVQHAPFEAYGIWCRDKIAVRRPPGFR